MLPEMERRRLATEKTLARYRGRRFDWRAGVHCVALARFQVRNMGHKPPTLPRVRSALSARRALRPWGSVTAMLDSLLPRIAPAQMLLGDLAVVPGDGGLDAVLVCVGTQKLMGWRADVDEMVILDVDLNELTGAWRV